MQFEVGKTYYTRSIGDHNCIIRRTIARRTAKTIETTDGGKFRIFLDCNGAEAIRPWGRFSMAPVLSAADTKEQRPDWEKSDDAPAPRGLPSPVAPYSKLDY